MIPTSNVTEAFKGVDVAILVGAMPRREGMERKDLLKANVKIFKQQGEAMDQHASKNVKVCVCHIVFTVEAHIMPKLGSKVSNRNAAVSYANL